MKDKLILKWLDDNIYLLIIGGLVILLGLFQPLLGALGVALLVYLVFHRINHDRSQERYIKKRIEALTEEFDSAAKHAIFNMPFPLAILDEKGHINWYNTPFLKMIGEEDILNEKISDVINSFPLNEVLEDEKKVSLDLKYKDKHYKIHLNRVDTSKSTSKYNTIIMLYWVDITGFVDLKHDYDSEKLVVALAYVDNYDDVKNNTPEANRPLIMGEIDKSINTYFLKYNGVVRKYENDKYLVILEN